MVMKVSLASKFTGTSCAEHLLLHKLLGICGESENDRGVRNILIRILESQHLVVIVALAFRHIKSALTIAFSHFTWNLIVYVCEYVCLHVDI